MKKSTLILCIIFIVTLHHSYTHAQTKLQKILNDINKNGNKNQPATNQQTTKQQPANNQTQSSNKNSTAAAFSAPAPNGLKVGDVAPDAVYVDAERLNDFSGAAVIQKGNSTALIDAKGNIVVSYNKYRFGNVHIDATEDYGIGGFFSASDENNGGYENVLINYKGEILSTNLFTLKAPGLAILREKITGTSADAFLDIKGNKYPIHYIKGMKIEKVTDGIVYVSQEVLDPQRAMINVVHYYTTLDGKQLTQQRFKETKAFSDGMALVGNPDNFGEMKYGFLNKQGVLAIPLQYSIAPSDFENGFATVTPKTDNDFVFALIDRKGDIKIKFTKDMLSKLRWTGADILRCGVICNVGGYAGAYVMDTTGNIISTSAFINNNNTNNAQGDFNRVTLLTRNSLSSDLNYFIALKGPSNNRTGLPNYGCINTDKKIIIPPIFETLLNFDPITKLSYAKLFISKGKGGPDTDVYREGYINDDGIFVIVKKTNNSTF